jgi:hypothetical protein
VSTRPHLAPYPVILNGSMTANITSAVTIIQKLSMMSYAASWTGTAPVGTLGVQVSNDYSLNAEGQVNNPGTWTNIVFNESGTYTPTVPVTGSPGTAFLDIDEIGAYAIRAVYTFTSGTGTLQVYFNAKVS